VGVYEESIGYVKSDSVPRNTDVNKDSIIFISNTRQVGARTQTSPATVPKSKGKGKRGSV